MSLLTFVSAYSRFLPHPHLFRLLASLAPIGPTAPAWRAHGLVALQGFSWPRIRQTLYDMTDDCVHARGYLLIGMIVVTPGFVGTQARIDGVQIAVQAGVAPRHWYIDTGHWMTI